MGVEEAGEAVGECWKKEFPEESGRFPSAAKSEMRSQNSRTALVAAMRVAWAGLRGRRRCSGGVDEDEEREKGGSSRLDERRQFRWIRDLRPFSMALRAARQMIFHVGGERGCGGGFISQIWLRRRVCVCGGRWVWMVAVTALATAHSQNWCRLLGGPWRQPHTLPLTRCPSRIPFTERRQKASLLAFSQGRAQQLSNRWWRWRRSEVVVGVGSGSVEVVSVASAMKARCSVRRRADTWRSCRSVASRTRSLSSRIGVFSAIQPMWGRMAVRAEWGGEGAEGRRDPRMSIAASSHERGMRLRADWRRARIETRLVMWCRCEGDRRAAARDSAAMLMVEMRSWMVARLGMQRRGWNCGERRSRGRRGLPQRGAVRHHAPGQRCSGSRRVMGGRARMPSTIRRRGSVEGVGTRGGGGLRRGI